jgi:hypothetical protein
LQPLVYYVQAVKSRSVWISVGNLLGRWSRDRKLRTRASLHTIISIRVIFNTQGRYARGNSTCGISKRRSSQVFQLNRGYLICRALGDGVGRAHERQQGRKYDELSYPIFHDVALLFDETDRTLAARAENYVWLSYIPGS